MQAMVNKRDAVQSKVLADGTVELRDARGSARLLRLAPGVLFYVCGGVLGYSFQPQMVEPAQREVDQTGALIMFVDGWELRSVDTAFREAWTEWFKENRQHFQMRLLVRSKLMEMAASIANLFTGMSVIKTFSNVASWEAECALNHRGFRRTPENASVKA